MVATTGWPIPGRAPGAHPVPLRRTGWIAAIDLGGLGSLAAVLRDAGFVCGRLGDPALP